MQQEKNKKDLLYQLGLLIKYLIKLRSQSFVCKTLKKNQKGTLKYWIKYVDANGNEDFEFEDPNYKTA